jgi:hypothetical protein
VKDPGAGPFRPVEQYSGLRLGEKLSEHQGQSRLVAVLATHPEWLYKEYKDPLPLADAAQLDGLIQLPAGLGPVDRGHIRCGASWPVARVVRDDQTCGVIIPRAPATFQAEFQLPQGRSERRMLHVDWLAQPDRALRARGIEPPSPEERLEVCISLAATAALFERRKVVYLDWSFTNAFWSQHEHTAYVIDVDGCSFGPRRMIESHGWTDPLFPLGAHGGHPVDRYRVALLVARCLVVERTSTDAATALARLDELVAARPELRRLRDVVVRAVSAARAEERPPVAELVRALKRARTPVPVASGSVPATTRSVPRPNSIKYDGGVSGASNGSSSQTFTVAIPQPTTPDNDGRVVAVVVLGFMAIVAVVVLVAILF